MPSLCYLHCSYLNIKIPVESFTYDRILTLWWKTDGKQTVLIHLMFVNI